MAASHQTDRLELCRVTTSDGLQLDGAFRRPAVAAEVAVLLIHGTGSSFYAPGLLEMLFNAAVGDGFPALRINTRGHDLAASIPGIAGSVRGGAAFERVADAHRDVTAWTDFLVERGYRQIVLVGHSLGGVKALWSQVAAPHPAVCGVVGVSPPRFVHRRFQADPRCDAFRRDYATAVKLIADGKGDQLLSVAQPLPIIITAAGFVEKYGPGDPLDYVPILPRIRCPKLIVLGQQTVDANPAFDDLPNAVAAAQDPTCSCQVIPGADINYRNEPIEVWRRIRGWLGIQANLEGDRGTEEVAP
jgi:pimeloyl-ACP methyl ester carboxylesterase